VNLAMMAAAERDIKLIADLEAHGSWLGKPQMMRIGRLTAADEARLRDQESQMGFVAHSFRRAFVDLRWPKAKRFGDN
jgi:hypothetical protein